MKGMNFEPKMAHGEVVFHPRSDFVFCEMAMGHNLWLHFTADEDPLATYFDVYQAYRALTHSQVSIDDPSHGTPASRVIELR